MYVRTLGAYFAHPSALSRRVFHAIKEAAFRLMFDGRPVEKTDLYRDVLLWDAVSQAGVPPCEYGLDGDGCVGPLWRYPQIDGPAPQRMSSGPNEEDGRGGLQAELPWPPADIGPRNPGFSVAGRKGQPARSSRPEGSRRPRTRQRVAR